ncbi:hypothetical protein ABPG77_004572 [Micractinium sp. CCAP 211/92]
MEVRGGGHNAAARSTAAAVAALLVLFMAYQECNRSGLATGSKRISRRTDVGGAGVPPLLPPPLPPEVAGAFVAATATADFRHDLVKAMRGWRRGIRTLVLTNATGELLAREQQEGLRYNEVWQHYQDFSNISTGKPGDVRAAVTPAYVRSTLGTNFKWLIYGDDDVVFFWPGLLRMLRGLDHRDPYFLTDNYFSQYPDGLLHQRKPAQPRCVPCTLDATGLDLGAANAVKTCNCSVAAMAEALSKPLAAMRRFPNQPPIFSINGGGGAVISAGLLQRLQRRRFEACVSGRGQPLRCAGSDCLLTICLWRQGFGYTDPGFELRHQGMLLFDAYERALWQAERDMLSLLANRGGCDRACQLRVRHAVSLHTNGKARQHAVLGSRARLAAFLHSAARAAKGVAPPDLLAWA